MNKHRVFSTIIIIKLSDCFNKWEAFNIPYRASYFAYNKIFILNIITNKFFNVVDGGSLGPGVQQDVTGEGGNERWSGLGTPGTAQPQPVGLYFG